VKVAAYAKCRWYVSRGLPTTFIAERLNVSETTVRTWRRYINHDRVFAKLRRRVMLLPQWQQDQLVTDLITRRQSSAR
jgi:transposase